MADFPGLRIHDPVELRHLGGRWFRLLRPIKVTWQGPGVGWATAPILVVAAGTETDLASIPRPALSLLPPVADHLRAAVIHDYLYDPPHFGFTREEADALFLAALEHDGVPLIVRETMHAAVRVGGGSYWESGPPHSPRPTRNQIERTAP